MSFFLEGWTIFFLKKKDISRKTDERKGPGAISRKSRAESLRYLFRERDEGLYEQKDWDSCTDLEVAAPR